MHSKFPSKKPFLATVKHNCFCELSLTCIIAIPAREAHSHHLFLTVWPAEHTNDFSVHIIVCTIKTL